MTGSIIGQPKKKVRARLLVRPWPDQPDRLLRPCKHGAVIPGNKGLGFHVIVSKLMRQFIGQTQTVDIRGLIIIVSLMTLFKYIYIYIYIYIYLTGQGRTSHHKHSRYCSK